MTFTTITSKKIITNELIFNKDNYKINTNNTTITITGFKTNDIYYIIPDTMTINEKQYTITDIDITFPIIDNTINYSDFDVICGNFEEAFGIPGGFSASCECLNGTFRTNCPGYVYSASCPPALVASVRYMIRYANKII